jgi:membrane fusion protein (multidrug efflux system)
MIEIRVTGGDEEPQVRRFETVPIRLGRSDDNDVVLTSKTCSRHHAEIIREGATYKIVDRGSANALLLGAETLTELVLSDGLSVGVGVYTLTFSLPEQAADATLLMPRVERTAAAPSTKEASQAVLYLTYRRRNQEQSLKIVSGAEYIIGRAPDADVVIDDKRSSAQHAQVFSKGSDFFVRDMGSSNGTLVDGKRTREAALVHGTEIVVGGTVITAVKERKELRDEAAIIEGTYLGAAPRGLDAVLAGRGSAAGLRTKGAAAAPEKKSVVGIAIAVAVVLGVVLVAGAAILVLRTAQGKNEEAAGSAAPGSPPPHASLVVQVASIVDKDLVTSINGTGTIGPGERVTVSVEVPGRILALPIEDGSVVEKGQLLGQIDDTDIRLQIDEARSAVSQERVNLAQEEYERQQRLFDSGVVTRSILDQTRQQYLSLDSAYNSTQAKIRQLRQHLTKTRVAAPISGRVAQKFVNQGEFVGPGSPLVALENMEDVLVKLELADRDIVKIEKGQTVEVTTDAFPDRVFEGIVDKMASAAHPVTRTFQVEVRIDNHDGSLRSGMIASLHIVLEKSRGLVVPSEALIDRIEGEAVVFVVADQIARRTKIRLGKSFDREVEVLDGLAEGDDVVVYGKEQVKDGQSIDSYERQ